MRNWLITGGTGTFGNAFSERVLQDNLADRLVIFSRDEVKQQQMRNQFDDSRLRFFLGDVRDGARLARAFQGIDTVVHSASLKQVDRSGTDADEFFKTICLGALNVIDAAHLAGVSRVVALSTDKAVSSVTPYGSFKSSAEWLFIGGNAWGHTKFSCVRYGNVLGSRGSVLELWERRVTSGSAILITDERMTRFWMTIGQAIDLVLLAIQRMSGGEIFIPKNVRRSSVPDLALKYFPGAQFKIVGKRSYEKTTESLVSPEEVDRLRDCGDVYVLQPLHVRWEPGPYGADAPGVGEDFQYRSDA